MNSSTSGVQKYRMGTPFRGGETNTVWIPSAIDFLRSMRRTDCPVIRVPGWRAPTHLPYQPIRNLRMTRDGFDLPCLRVHPQRVRSPFPLEETAISAEVFQQGAAFHSTATVSHWAARGSPRIASARGLQESFEWRLQGFVDMRPWSFPDRSRPAPRDNTRRTTCRLVRQSP